MVLVIVSQLYYYHLCFFYFCIDLMQHQYDIILLQIKVNGIDFHIFQHRIPMEQVRGLQIAGDVSIQTINFIGVSPQLRESSALMLRALLGKIN